MRRFLKFTLLFSLLLLVISVLLIEIPEYYLERRADFKLTEPNKFIVIGHSHSECSFNDSLIENLTNLSGSGESYFYTYFKIREVLAQNPSIETVFIEYTNNQISPIMDDWTWDDEHINYRYPKFSPFMSTKDKILLASNNFKGFINSNSLAIKENMGRILSRNYKYETESSMSNPESDRDILDSLITNARKQGKLKKDTELSTVNIKYLRMIVDFCKKNGKEVILVRSPLHESYRGYANESLYQSIRKKYFSKIKYLDFSKVDLDNSNFYDLEHLNTKGANTFSIWFNFFLKKNQNLNRIDTNYLDLNLDTSL